MMDDAVRILVAGWLAGCWFASGVVVGAAAWRCIHRLTGGDWGEAWAAPIAALARRWPIVMLCFVPVAFAAPGLLAVPFATSAASADGRHAFLALWQRPTVLVLRDAACLVAWSVVVVRSGRGGFSAGGAAAALAALLVATSLLAFDWIAALVPGWSSSALGMVVASGQLFAGAAALIVLACRGRPPPRHDATADVAPADDPHPTLERDWGNLLLTATLLWAYLSFMQLLIVWAENLPREIAWYVPRWRGGWARAGIALAVLHAALPMALLVFRAVKERPRRLAALAWAMLGAHGLEAAWLIVPSIDPDSRQAIWIAPLAIGAVGAIAFAPLLPRHRRARHLAHA